MHRTEWLVALSAFSVACSGGNAGEPRVVGDSGSSLTDATATDASAPDATSEVAPPDGGDAGLPPPDAADSDASDASPCDAVTISPPVDLTPANDPAFLANWEVALAAHDGVATAAWIAMTATNLVIRSATSVDGQTFSTPKVVPLAQSFGDPTVGIAADGTLYIASICDAPDTVPPSDICVVFSTDHGSTFSQSFRVSEPFANPNELRDRPWMAVAPDGRVVITYADIEVDSNLDVIGPATLRIVVGTRTGNTMSFKPSRELPTGVAEDGGVDGGIPAFEAYNGTMAFDRSGALHLAYQVAPPNSVSSTIAYLRMPADLMTIPEPQMLGPGGLPTVATAGSQPGANEVAILDYSGDGSSVQLLRSHDGGDHFDAPETLSTPGREIDVPWIAGDENGAFHAVWEDRPAGNTNPWTVNYVHVPFGGPPRPTIAVSTGFRTTDQNIRMIGDFIGVYADHGLPVIAWSETTGNQSAMVRGAFGRCQ